MLHDVHRLRLRASRCGALGFPRFGERGLKRADFAILHIDGLRVGLGSHRPFRPMFGRPSGDLNYVVARFLGQSALARKPTADASGTAVVGGRRETEVPELLDQVAQKCGRRRQRLKRIERILSPRSAAVPGMNCAMPLAPTGLTTLERKRLSCQIRRLNSGVGRSFSSAASLKTLHMDSRVGSAVCCDACDRLLCLLSRSILASLSFPIAASIDERVAAAGFAGRRTSCVALTRWRIRRQVSLRSTRLRRCFLVSALTSADFRTGAGLENGVDWLSKKIRQERKRAQSRGDAAFNDPEFPRLDAPPPRVGRANPNRQSSSPRAR